MTCVKDVTPPPGGANCLLFAVHQQGNELNERTMSVSKWRHQMETFSALLALCVGNSLSAAGELMDHVKVSVIEAFTGDAILEKMKTAIAPLLLPLKEALNTANTEMKSMKSQLAGKESTITSMAREIADLQGPISLTIFPSQFKFDGNFSPAVVPCAKYCSDHFISIWIGAKWNFHHIWIVMEKLLVKWAPGLQWWPRAAGQKGICEGLWGTQNHRGHYRHQNPIWPRQTDEHPPPPPPPPDRHWGSGGNPPSRHKVTSSNGNFLRVTGP